MSPKTSVDGPVDCYSMLFSSWWVKDGESISFAIMEPMSLEETLTKCAPPILQVGSSTGTALHTLKLPPVPLLHTRSKAWSPPRGEVASMCQPPATSDWWSIFGWKAIMLYEIRPLQLTYPFLVLWVHTPKVKQKKHYAKTKFTVIGKKHQHSLCWGSLRGL